MLIVRASTFHQGWPFRVRRSQRPSIEASPSPGCSPRREMPTHIPPEPFQHHRRTAACLSPSLARDTRYGHRRDRKAATSSAGSGPRSASSRFEGAFRNRAARPAPKCRAESRSRRGPPAHAPKAPSIACLIATPSRRFRFHQIGYHHARRQFRADDISTIRPYRRAPASTRSAAISQASVGRRACLALKSSLRNRNYFCSALGSGMGNRSSFSPSR